MGITCSTDYARQYKLTEVPAKGKFVCLCRNVSPVFGKDIDKMSCSLHVWECPI